MTAFTTLCDIMQTISSCRHTS